MDQLDLEPWHRPAQERGDPLRFPDRVDDHACAAAALQLLLQELREPALVYAQEGDAPFPLALGDGLLKHLVAVRPRQQRIAPAPAPRARLRALSQVGPDQRLPPPGRERGRKEDHRHAVAAQPLQRAIEIAVHVRVVGMALVHDHDLSREPQVPEHDVLLPQRGHQQLVHRPHDEVGQERLLAALEPAVDPEPLLRVLLLRDRPPGKELGIRLVERRRAVRQADGVGHVLGLGASPRQQAVEQAVGRGLRGQAEEEAPGLEALREDLRGRERRLGLSHAHLRLQNPDPRRRDLAGAVDHRALDGVGRKPEPRPEDRVLHPRAGALPGGCEPERPPRPVHALRIRILLAEVGLRDQGEEGHVARDPVRHDQQPCQQHLLRRREGRELRRRGQAALRQGPRMEFLPDALPLRLLPFPIIIPSVDFQLVLDFVTDRGFLGLSMMRARDGGHALPASEREQDRLAGPRMGGFACMEEGLRQGQRRAQSLPRLGQAAQEPILVYEDPFPQIMGYAQISCKLYEFLLREVDLLAHDLRDPVLDEALEHAGRVQRVHPEREPIPALLRVRLSRHLPREGAPTCLLSFHAPLTSLIHILNYLLCILYTQRLCPSSPSPRLWRILARRAIPFRLLPLETGGAPRVTHQTVERV